MKKHLYAISRWHKHGKHKHYDGIQFEGVIRIFSIPERGYMQEFYSTERKRIANIPVHRILCKYRDPSMSCQLRF